MAESAAAVLDRLEGEAAAICLRIDGCARDQVQPDVTAWSGDCQTVFYLAIHSRG